MTILLKNGIKFYHFIPKLTWCKQCDIFFSGTRSSWMSKASCFRLTYISLRQDRSTGTVRMRVLTLLPF